jgi:hypothetical protein
VTNSRHFWTLIRTTMNLPRNTATFLRAEASIPYNLSRAVTNFFASYLQNSVRQIRMQRNSPNESSTDA